MTKNRIILGDATFYHGDCLDILKTLPDKSINCCVTSPPYFGLRDYGHKNQIGLEVTPDDYVRKLVNVFREVMRVLRDDGTLWLNLGDSYTGQQKNTGQHGYNDNRHNRNLRLGGNPVKGLKSKNLIGIPWLVAFALQAEGWYWRQVIIWNKPNPMPESVTDRCTTSHEYILILSKSAKYYFDNEAIKEPVATATVKRLSQSIDTQKGSSRIPGKNKGNMKAVGNKDFRNKRSVWTVTTKPFKGAHFAVYSLDLIEPCILAGCPEGGIVIDPFSGSNTTALAAYRNRRKTICCELNENYFKLGLERYRNEIKQMRLCDIKHGNRER